MVETEYVLRQTYSAIFANGVARTPLPIGPTAAYTRWVLTRYTIATSLKVTPYPTGNFTLFRGDPALGFQMDYTQQFQGDTSGANDVELGIGDYVVGVWTGTSAFNGTVATITFDGKVYVRGRRSY